MCIVIPPDHNARPLDVVSMVSVVGSGDTVRQFFVQKASEGLSRRKRPT